MTKRKLGILFLALSTVTSCYLWLNNYFQQQKRKESMPLVIWESSLKESTKDLFVEGKLTEENVSLMQVEGFLEDNFLSYTICLDLSQEACVRYVNEGVISEKTIGRLKELMKDKFFLEKNLVLYLENPKENVRKTIEFVNAGRVATFYKDEKKVDLSKGYLLNVNKYYRFEEDYVPEDLQIIDGRYGFPGKLRKEAYDAFREMEKEARKNGLTLEIISAYRSYQRQKELFDSYTLISGLAAAETYSARPGFSEHQSGLVLDILSPGYDFDSFAKSKEAKWLADNAHRFGYILRYPLGKEDITGYIYEPWHFRYIGKEAAQHMKQTGLCYDEYYSVFVENN